MSARRGTPAEIAIAFDVPDLEAALALDARLGRGEELAKVGLELYTAAGPEAVRTLAARGRRVFLDLKLHDIPNTVKRAACAASRLGAELLTVHALGGAEMIAAAVEGAREGGGGTGIVAVTLLTSLDPDHLPPGFRAPLPLEDTAAAMTAMALDVGARGIVCSALELPGLRSRLARGFYAVTPGIRPAGTSKDDQRRVATVAGAVEAGADLLVIGRAVTTAGDPALALRAVRQQRDEAARSLQA